MSILKSNKWQELLAFKRIITYLLEISVSRARAYGLVPVIIHVLKFQKTEPNEDHVD